MAPAALGHPNQGPHQAHLFDLFFEEPLHELLAEEVTLVAGHRRQLADLFGDRAFLIQRQRQRVVWFVELIAHRTHTRDLDVHIAIEQMLHQHHRVVSFLDRLAVKVLRQLWQFGTAK